MEHPFDPTGWQPTKVPNPTKPIAIPNVHLLSRLLATQTRYVLKHPYDSQGWLRRARTLQQLQYPELAVGDAFKAQELSKSILERYATDRNHKLGYGSGFWMLDDERFCTECRGCEVEEQIHMGNSGFPDDQLERRYSKIQQLSYETQLFNLSSPATEVGDWSPRPYPWMSKRHLIRDDNLLALVHDEICSSTPDDQAPFCTIKRHAFGPGDSTSEALGVFATRPIPANTTFLIDKTKLFGCGGPGTDFDALVDMTVFDDAISLSSSSSKDFEAGDWACGDPLHPNVATDDYAHDLRWIRDLPTITYYPQVILSCRILLTCIVENGADSHPLDHPLVARLQPKYGGEADEYAFSLDEDIRVPNLMLQRLGIDIFANHNFDTWVLFTLDLRHRNNAWANPIHTGIHPLFSFFNHSCEPNVDWSTVEEPVFLTVKSLRDVEVGEQLFVTYDGFLEQGEMQYAKRQERLRTWLIGECNCERCEREKGVLEEVVEGEWSTSEDEVVGRWEDGRVVQQIAGAEAVTV